MTEISQRRGLPTDVTSNENRKIMESVRCLCLHSKSMYSLEMALFVCAAARERKYRDTIEPAISYQGSINVYCEPMISFSYILIIPCSYSNMN